MNNKKENKWALCELELTAWDRMSRPKLRTADLTIAWPPGAPRKPACTELITKISLRCVRGEMSAAREDSWTWMRSRRVVLVLSGSYGDGGLLEGRWCSLTSRLPLPDRHTNTRLCTRSSSVSLSVSGYVKPVLVAYSHIQSSFDTRHIFFCSAGLCCRLKCPTSVLKMTPWLN